MALVLAGISSPRCVRGELIDLTKSDHVLIHFLFINGWPLSSEFASLEQVDRVALLAKGSPQGLVSTERDGDISNDCRRLPNALNSWSIEFDTEICAAIVLLEGA